MIAGRVFGTYFYNGTVTGPSRVGSSCPGACPKLPKQDTAVDLWALGTQRGRDEPRQSLQEL